MLGKLRNFFNEWLDREEPFIFWMLILNITCSIAALESFFGGLDIFSACCHYVMFNFFAVFLIDLFLYCLLRKYKRIHKLAKIILIIPTAFMFAVDIFTLYFYKSPMNDIMFEISLGTSFYVSIEYLKTNLTNYNFWIFVFAVFALIFILRLVFIFIFKRLKNLMLISFLLIFLMGLSNVGSSIYVYDILQLYDEPVIMFMPSMSRALAFIRIPLLYHVNNKNMKYYETMLNETPKNLSLTKNESTIPYVIFILGESTNRNYMSLYSYSLPTNPLLSKRLNDGLYVFKDVISPHGHSIPSFRKIFNFYHYESTGKWYSYHNIFSILKKAGYHTAWISNHESSAFANLWGLSPSAIFSRLCDVSKFANILRKDIYQGILPDEVLLPFLDEELKNAHEKNFYLIHLFATHLQYKNRYTPEFSKFNSNDITVEPGRNLTAEQRQTIAEYDNSVLYNDFIVDEIIKRFEDKNAIIIYISDHGQSVYDVENFMGHLDGIIHPSLIEIPMLIWTSKKFQAEYPDLNKRISDSVNRPYMTDDIIHTMLDITGIETADYEPSRSIINDSFDATRPRIYSNHLYDKEKGLIKIPQGL